ncbi:hypothetical protein JXO59_01455 [candidate division KSB1 bacterium]|nr:hypothetical protein [candidate division KSB1 bacterium]
MPVNRFLEFYPNAVMFFLEGDNSWQVNLDAALTGRRHTFYAGAGLALAEGAETMDTGLNLFVGLQLGRLSSSVRPFIEPR